VPNDVDANNPDPVEPIALSQSKEFFPQSRVWFSFLKGGGQRGEGEEHAGEEFLVMGRRNRVSRSGSSFSTSLSVSIMIS